VGKIGDLGVLQVMQGAEAEVHWEQVYVGVNWEYWSCFVKIKGVF